MEVSTEAIKEVRGRTNAGVLECKNALLESGGDIGKAIRELRVRGLAIAEKKAGRVVGEGVIEAYVHHTGQVGAMVEVNCETDFVARTDVFKQLAHDLAMQVAAASPQFITAEEIPPDAELEPQEVCLMLQLFIKEPSKTVGEIVTEAIARVGENIKIQRFSRFELGG